MKVIELLHQWEETAGGAITKEQFCVQLPIEDAAKLHALAELYPRRSMSQLITDLLSAALTEVESSLPYVRGDTIVGTDELGDPLYEDVGPTPVYLALMRKHLSAYQNPDDQHDSQH